MKLDFQNSDPSNRGFQFFEELATAYWYSEVFFAAIELNLFDLIETGHQDLDVLSNTLKCGKMELHRLIKVLQRLELIHQTDQGWINSQAVRLYLLQESDQYMGDFFLYRKYMKKGWEGISQKLSIGENLQAEAQDNKEDYKKRNYDYVRAMDEIAKRKADEIAELLNHVTWESPILDIGGGAGALSRALIQGENRGEAILFDLPEVIRAAETIYSKKEEWVKIQTIEGDFFNHRFKSNDGFGLILLSNFLHAYGEDTARALLKKAVGLLSSDGILLIHDYFPDRSETFPHKGALYDLNMMLNTYDGVCQESSTIISWLKEIRIEYVEIQDLSTDSSIILASRKKINGFKPPGHSVLAYKSKQLGFRKSVILSTEKITTASWVQEKCSYGCAGFGNNLQCPPHNMDLEKTNKIIKEYQWALLFEGSPPGKHFHKQLLELERLAFLSGYYKVLSFGAGPCQVCETCNIQKACRFPEKARPSMEGSGIDVYETAKNAGILLKPVTNKNQYVKYIGLLLLE